MLLACAEVLQPCMGACNLLAGGPEEAGLPGAALCLAGYAGAGVPSMRVLVREAFVATECAPRKV